MRAMSRRSKVDRPTRFPDSPADWVWILGGTALWGALAGWAQNYWRAERMGFSVRMLTGILFTSWTVTFILKGGCPRGPKDTTWGLRLAIPLVAAMVFAFWSFVSHLYGFQ